MNKMMNMPEIRLGIVAVSRDCFPASLSAGRRTAVCKACSAKGIDVYECPTTVESEKDMLKAVEELKEAGVNALVVYLATSAPRLPKLSLPRDLVCL